MENKTEDKTKVIMIRVTEKEHRHLKEKAAHFGVTMSNLFLDGVEKEIMLYELVEKYDNEYVPAKGTGFDTKEMIKQKMEQKKKIAEEFAARIVF